MTRPEQEDEHGDADQDDEPENDGCRQQDERDHEVRRDRAGQPGRDVVSASGSHRVVRDCGDDLARGELVADGRAAREAWWATTCASLKEAWSQLETAQRCRITPATACVAPSPSRTSVQTARAWLSCSTMPVWIARPIAKGISACATIQATPKSTPATSVRTWNRPTHSSSRTGERVSGIPGLATGSRITACSYGRMGKSSAPCEDGGRGPAL